MTLTRKEYWSRFFGFLLVVWGTMFVLNLLLGYFPMYVHGFLEAIYQVPYIDIFISMLGICLGVSIIGVQIAWVIHRFHDAGLSGWMLFLVLLPYIGPIFVLIVLLLPTKMFGMWRSYH